MKIVILRTKAEFAHDGQHVIHGALRHALAAKGALAAAELLFCCPECGLPTVRPIVGDLLTLLLLVGVEPLRLSEPSLAPEDVPPDVPPLTRDDLLEWHEQLQGIRFITPWEK